MELDLKKTYLLGFRIIALAKLYHQADKRQKRGLRMAIKRDADKLVDFQKSFGAWDYDKNTSETSWDFSNTQIAVLALGEAVSCGVEVDLNAFRK
ncbi:MAG: hypothetical protein GWP05_10495, partial [Anaerolineaceae bacterium]|nr:hypothetical protein [Anaerolineaceae bacterium]